MIKWLRRYIFKENWVVDRKGLNDKDWYELGSARMSKRQARRLIVDLILTRPPKSVTQFRMRKIDG